MDFNFCPSCHQKRVVEFGEHLHEEVIEDVTHRQWVFSLPKRLRPYFMYDRKLLSKLSLCTWKVLSEYLKASVSMENPACKPATGKSHIPGRGEQMVRYYGYYSNKSRGERKKEQQEEQDGNASDSVQVIVDSDIGRKKFRKNRARAGLCERRFREVFTEVTGMQPKKYYDAMRTVR
jgi:hypothetical protein